MLRSFVKTYILSLSILVATAALADSKYSAEYSSCTKGARGDTSALVDCSNKELDKQNARMDRAYKSAMASLPAQVSEKLQASQALWIKFREEDCGTYYILTGGTIDMLNGSGCDLSMTLKRADDIEWITKNGGE